MIARSLRLTRLRVAAIPTALDTTKPTRERSTDRPVLRCRTKLRVPTRTPRRTTSSKSAEQRMRCAAGSTTRLRQIRYGGPCGDALTKSHDQRGYACATGSHVLWPACGYSAEKSAYSRQISKSTSGKLFEANWLQTEI